MQYNETANFTERQILLPTNLFRLGLGRFFELRVLSQYENIRIKNKSYEGISDLEVGAKIQLLNKKDINTAIAFLTHLILPTGSKALSLENYGCINKLSFSHQLAETINLGYNIGYSYYSVGNGDLFYSIAIGFAINDKVSIYGEPYGEYLEFAELEASFDAGFTYLLNSNFQLDFSFGTGINHRMNYLSTGFSWLIAKK